jgi:hypothetical protein
MGEFSAERVDPLDGPVLVKGDFICRRCLAAELPALRRRLQEIHLIELALYLLNWPRSLVMTTEAEMDAVQNALAGN